MDKKQNLEGRGNINIGMIILKWIIENFQCMYWIQLPESSDRLL